MNKSLSFRGLIRKLEDYWEEQGCAVLTPYDMEMGAGTYHSATTLFALGDKPWKAAFVQPSRRPSDARFGLHPNRLYRHHQFQVILKPAPSNVQELYLNSLKALGVDFNYHDIRFVEDDWENPTLGAAGLGWEVWCDGMEITQFTYFQQIGGIPCSTVSAELAYGLERLSLYLQNKDSVYDLDYNTYKNTADRITYKDVFFRFERDLSEYSINAANIQMLFKHFADVETECGALLESGAVLAAYEHVLKASHIFNTLDARGVISTLERGAYIVRIRSLMKSCCQLWMEL